jgi:hypothetical protein
VAPVNPASAWMHRFPLLQLHPWPMTRMQER